MVVIINLYVCNLRACQVALVVKNLPASAGDIRELGSIPELERSPGGEHGNPLQYSCLENPMDRGSWQATVHVIAKKSVLKLLSGPLSYLSLNSPMTYIKIE